MKKLILLYVLVLSSTLCFAQLVELEGQSNVYYGTASDLTDMHFAWDVINATDQTIDMRCRREGIYEVPGTVNQFCWGILCSPFGNGVGYSSEIVTLGPGGITSSFYANYRHNGNAGQSIIKFCYYDNDNIANEFCFEVNLCVDANCVVSVDEKNTPILHSLSPNPSSGLTTIQYNLRNSPPGGKLLIYNMTGVLVKEILLSQSLGMIVIDAADFQNGVYLCNVQAGGALVESTRMVIAH